MRDRRCKQLFAALSEYLDGDLPVRNCRELERHLRGCEPCLAFLDSLKKTIQACRRYEVEEARTRPSPRVRAALQAALRESR